MNLRKKRQKKTKISRATLLICAFLVLALLLYVLLQINATVLHRLNDTSTTTSLDSTSSGIYMVDYDNQDESKKGLLLGNNKSVKKDPEKRVNGMVNVNSTNLQFLHIPKTGAFVIISSLVMLLVTFFFALTSSNFTISGGTAITEAAMKYNIVSYFFQLPSTTLSLHNHFFHEL